MTTLLCPRCQSNDVINIDMTMDGEAVSFYSCHACEKRWWYRDGQPVDLPNVLELAKRTKRPAAKRP